ncbi:hypothetical protein LINGRAHAP2_LOCUS16464 [Linum grandiflorum]
MAAFRSTGLWRSAVNSLRGNKANTYATSTIPKMKPYTPAADVKDSTGSRWWPPRRDYVPIYVVLGFIAMSTTMGVYTLTHQIRHNPAVRVKKKERETMPEVVEPEKVEGQSKKFLDNSWFRKVAHVQEFKSGIHDLPDSNTGDVYAQPSRAESLKSVGVDPKQQAGR